MTARAPRYVVQRVHNNNVLLALAADGRSVVLTGGGIGFGARRGQLVDPQWIEAVYVPQTGGSADVAAGTLAGIPTAVVATAREIIERSQQDLGLARPEILLLPVADHLHQALRRASEGIVLEIPLVWEVRGLYPRELRAGQEALRIARARHGIELPPDEATAFALHFVSAHFTGPLIDRTVQMTQSLTAIFDIIDTHRGSPLDRRGAAAARFVAHLRFLFVRLSEGRAVAGAPPQVREALRSSLPEAMAVSADIADRLAADWGSAVSDDEATYIGLHVHRLLSEIDADEGGPTP